MQSQKTKVVVVGGGAIGGYVGGHMARGGEDVTLIDMWPEHVEHIRKHGIHLSGSAPDEAASIPIKALHVSDVQALSKERPVDIAFISVKSYDTEWATMMIKPYLGPDGFVVSLQNCINEERIAGIVGWGKTLGVAVSALGAELYKPGHIMRTMPLGGDRFFDFHVGEVHGRITPRAEEVARLVRHADSADVTTNLWGERWSKLIVNSMRNGLSAVSGLGGNARETNPVTRSIGIRLGSEGIRVGQALGYRIEPVAGIQAETFARAGEGDKAALDAVVASILARAVGRSDDQRPSMAQDIHKGRRTETEFINGYVAAMGEQIGLPAPLHAKINELVKRVERGEITPSVDLVQGL